MGRLFGTDGVRGIAGSELSCTRAFEIGRAAAAIMAEGRRRRPLFVIGGDTRASTSMLVSAVGAGLCSVGADVIDLGVIPTPAVAYLIGLHKADAGVMITASHNPFEYNGIKIFGGDGRKLPDLLEDRIESAVLDGAPLPPCPVGGDVGRITRCGTAVKDYCDRLRACTVYSPVGLRVAIDCANGAASLTAGELFTSLGAEVTLLSSEPNGVNVNDGCGSTHMDALVKAVKSGNFDCGVAFDGDADRCLFVDERGEVVDGDRIMAICALDLAERGRLNGRTVVGTVMTNLGFSRFCEENGLHFVATKVGDRFVLEEMLQGDYSFGGEQSGHIIFRDLATTGDGQLTALQLLSVIKRSGKRLSELAAVMTVYPQVSRNVTVSHDGKLIFYTDPEICEAINTARTELGGDGRIIVRPSGTEPLIRIMVEGSDLQMIKGIADRVAGIICERIGKAE